MSVEQNDPVLVQLENDFRLKSAQIGEARKDWQFRFEIKDQNVQAASLSHVAAHGDSSARDLDVEDCDEEVGHVHPLNDLPVGQINYFEDQIGLQLRGPD